MRNFEYLIAFYSYYVLFFIHFEVGIFSFDNLLGLFGCPKEAEGKSHFYRSDFSVRLFNCVALRGSFVEPFTGNSRKHIYKFLTKTNNCPEQTAWTEAPLYKWIEYSLYMHDVGI